MAAGWRGGRGRTPAQQGSRPAWAGPWACAPPACSAHAHTPAVCCAARPHRSSLVLRDRLRIHMQAAARVPGRSFESAAVICRRARGGRGGWGGGDITPAGAAQEAACTPGPTQSAANPCKPAHASHARPQARAAGPAKPPPPAAALCTPQAAVGAPPSPRTAWPGNAAPLPPAGAAARCLCWQQGGRLAQQSADGVHVVQAMVHRPLLPLCSC